MITFKIEYSTTQAKQIANIQREQNRCVGKAYQFLKSKPSQREITQYLNAQNCNIDSWFIQSSVYEAKGMLKADTELGKFRVFGGKKNRIKYDSGEIDRDAYLKRKLFPIISIGEAPQRGNRKFEIHSENNQIIFKPFKGMKIELNIPHLRDKRFKQLQSIQRLMEEKLQPVTFKLDSKYIYISYGEIKLRKSKGRNIAGIDLNPNWIGVTIITPEQEIIWARNFDISQLKNPNKQIHELSEIAKSLTKQFMHFNVKRCVMEKLTIKSKDHKNGKNYNKLVNNKWNRNDFIHFIRKRCNMYGIIFKETNPAYSSIIGNFLNRSLVDPCAAAKELARRGIKDSLQPYDEGFYPDLPKQEHLPVQLAQAVQKVSDWKELGHEIKNSKLRYRISADSAVFQTFQHRCSLVRSSDGIVCGYTN